MVLQGEWRFAMHIVIGMIVGIAAFSGWQLRPRASRSATVMYTTSNGERANVTLPGGGTVALSVGSRLLVPADYPNGNHTLRLEGEALFSVRHHDRVPLVVIAGAVRTQVLGTSFAVRHYSTDSLTTVAVQSGKVAVADTATRRSVVLDAGRQAALHPGGTVTVRNIASGRFSFANGILSIDSLPLRDAVIELSRWYDADIRLGDSSLAPRLVTGGFRAESLSDCATILEWTFGIRVVRNGRVLTLYSK
jgi:ferric-dicitrate binding protein FerR (iron transport regulator)